MIRHLLLIDDDPIYSFIFPELIRGTGKVEHFQLEQDGRCGLRYLDSCSRDTFPDLILVDLKMPVLDGFGFLEEYGARFAPQWPDTVVMVMSSSIRQKDREDVFAHPFVSDFLSKPITESLLEEITEKYFQLK
jgi:CheY-like chemotaxis protein